MDPVVSHVPGTQPNTRETTCITVNERGETLILSSNDNRYYGLNASATLIWTHLLRGLSLPAITKIYSQHFRIDLATAANDVHRCALEFETRGWIANIFDGNQDED